MKRLITAALLIGSIASAETVYVTPAGKTFHKATTCGILKRSTKVLQAERAAAEQHALKPCRSCWTAKKPTNSAWAKETK